MKFVDITNDVAFRKIFGNENKKSSLISFLNAVINLPNGNIIKDVDILNPYQLPKLAEGKSTILDVRAKDKQGNTFIVEMQIAESEYFHKRVLYYTSQSYTGQITEGKEYKKLYPVYFIGILEFKVGKNANYLTCHKVLDVETKEQVFQDVEFNLIELPKFNKKIEELKTIVDQWVYFIKNAKNLNLIPENIKDKGLLDAYNQADRHNWKPVELEDYERASIKEGDEIYRLETAVKRAMEKGEKKEKNKIAKNALKMGMRVGDIVKLTGLTKEEIKKL
jgi:predicted transposase/invertase (TIGR01784 family)